MKCPFCQQELEIGGVDGILRGCPKCRNLGTEMLWQELICTRKALGMALDWLRDVATPEKCDDDLCREFTSRKLAEIKTALEQKDKR